MVSANFSDLGQSLCRDFESRVLGSRSVYEVEMDAVCYAREWFMCTYLVLVFGSFETAVYVGLEKSTKNTRPGPDCYLELSIN